MRAREERILRRRELALRVRTAFEKDPDAAFARLNRLVLVAFAHGMLLGGVCGISLGWVIWG